MATIGGISINFPSSLDGINTELSNHSATLSAIITALESSDLSAVNSIEELSLKFEGLRKQLVSKTEEIARNGKNAVIDATIAAANPATTALSVEILSSPLGPFQKFIVEAKAAVKLLGLVSEIVLKYSLILIALAKKVIELVKLGVTLGAEAAASFLQSQMISLLNFLNGIKKWAVNKSKKIFVEEFTASKEKEKQKLLEELKGTSLSPAQRETNVTRITQLDIQINWVKTHVIIDETI